MDLLLHSDLCVICNVTVFLSSWIKMMKQELHTGAFGGLFCYPERTFHMQRLAHAA